MERTTDVSLTAVDSTSIDLIGYDAEERLLHVRFKETQQRYVYYAVEPAIYAALLAADSIGAHFNTQIKGHYKFKKLPDRKSA